MTAEELKSIIAAGLPCDHLTLEGDGRHWYATVVSSAFEGRRSIALKTDEVHALSMKTYTPAEWAALPR